MCEYIIMYWMCVCLFQTIGDIYIKIINYNFSCYYVNPVTYMHIATYGLEKNNVPYTIQIS